jgi:hypothetical protein
MHMAQNAWKDVTPETIKNCWKHADIRRDPIILHIPQSLSQKGWKVIHTFADPSSSMTLPQAEESLKQIFGDQYNDNEWRPALKVVTETEPDEDTYSLIKALQEESCTRGHLFVPAEYTEVAARVSAVISELEGRNRIFEGAPSADAYIEPDVEKEVEATPIRTDDELVAEVLREQAIESGEIIEVEDNESEEDDEPEMTTNEILLSISKLRKALLTRGEICIHTTRILAQAQDEILSEQIRNARQTTLGDWWGQGGTDAPP